jgi:hypothetical protein
MREQEGVLIPCVSEGRVEHYAHHLSLQGSSFYGHGPAEAHLRRTFPFPSSRLLALWGEPGATSCGGPNGQVRAVI